MSTRDVFGVVREHRWMSADEQAEMLRPECAAVLTLGGGTNLHKVDRARLYTMAVPGRVFRFVHVFLLAQPRIRGLKEAKADFREALKHLTDVRKATIEDVVHQLSTEIPGHRKAMVAVAERMIGRSRQGARSANNGKQGNQEAEYSDDCWTDAKLIWRDTIEYPHWRDCVKAYEALDKKHGNKEPFTVWRAHDEWGKRIKRKPRR